MKDKRLAMTFRVPGSLKRRILKEAMKRNMTTNDFITKCFEEGLELENKPPKKNLGVVSK